MIIRPAPKWDARGFARKDWLRLFVGVVLAGIFVFTSTTLRRGPDPIFEGRLASEWTQDLLSADYKVRGEAQTALKILGERAVPQLCVFLKKRNAPWERHLVRLNGIFPSLNYRLVDAVQCRERGAEMLGLLGVKSKQAVPDLVAVLGIDPASTEVERALIRIGPASAVKLSDGLTRSRKLWIRYSAARLLREFDPDAKMIAALIHGSKDPEAMVREQSAESLGVVAKGDAAAAAALVRLGSDPEAGVRASALKALGSIGIVEAKVIAVLEDGLTDASTEVEIEAARALWWLRQDPELIVPVLTEILGGNERRWQAAYALGDMGPVAAAAVPALAKALAEEHVPRPFRTPPSTAFALGKIGRAAIPELSSLLLHPEARMRMGSLLAFGIMGTDGKDAVPALLKLLRDQDSEVRHTAALTLAAVGAAPEQIVAGLTDCLTAEDIYMRSAAAAALREIAPDGDWVVSPE